VSDPQRGDDLLGGALDELTRGIRARLAPEEGAGTDWMALFDELRARASQLGMRDRTGEIDDFGMDPEALRAAAPLLSFLRERWWRIEVEGADTLPFGPALFVSNRAGLLPWDGLMIAEVVEEATGRRPRFLVADGLITLPWAQPRLTRWGGVRACPENAERLLRTSRSVVAFPEGMKGAAKVFRDRYRLQRFGRGGSVRLALELGVPIVPVGVVGAEEANPILFKVEALAREAGLPFLPVTPTFPWLGPLGVVPLPSKWAIHFGAPFDWKDLPPDAADDELLVARLNEDVRDAVQDRIDEALHAREGVFA
jgi:1-acyl-sn-glycerol-3-phosphate acyltransferase